METFPPCGREPKLSDKIKPATEQKVGTKVTMWRKVPLVIELYLFAKFVKALHFVTMLQFDTMMWFYETSISYWRIPLRLESVAAKGKKGLNVSAVVLLVSTDHVMDVRRIEGLVMAALDMRGQVKTSLRGLSARDEFDPAMCRTFKP